MYSSIYAYSLSNRKSVCAHSSNSF